MCNTQWLSTSVNEWTFSVLKQKYKSWLVVFIQHIANMENEMLFRCHWSVPWKIVLCCWIVVKINFIEIASIYRIWRPMLCILSYRCRQRGRVCVNFILSLATSCPGLQDERPQTAYAMSMIWVSHIVDIVLIGWAGHSMSITGTSHLAISW